VESPSKVPTAPSTPRPPPDKRGSLAAIALGLALAGCFADAGPRGSSRTGGGVTGETGDVAETSRLRPDETGETDETGSSSGAPVKPQGTEGGGSSSGGGTDTGTEGPTGGTDGPPACDNPCTPGTSTCVDDKTVGRCVEGACGVVSTACDGGCFGGACVGCANREQCPSPEKTECGPDHACVALESWAVVKVTYQGKTYVMDRTASDLRSYRVESGWISMLFTTYGVGSFILQVPASVKVGRNDWQPDWDSQGFVWTNGSSDGFGFDDSRSMPNGYLDVTEVSAVPGGSLSGHVEVRLWTSSGSPVDVDVVFSARFRDAV